MTRIDDWCYDKGLKLYDFGRELIPDWRESPEAKADRQRLLGAYTEKLPLFIPLANPSDPFGFKYFDLDDIPLMETSPSLPLELQPTALYKTTPICDPSEAEPGPGESCRSVPSAEAILKEWKAMTAESEGRPYSGILGICEGTKNFEETWVEGVSVRHDVCTGKTSYHMVRLPDDTPCRQATLFGSSAGGLDLGISLSDAELRYLAAATGTPFRKICTDMPDVSVRDATGQPLRYHRQFPWQDGAVANLTEGFIQFHERYRSEFPDRDKAALWEPDADESRFWEIVDAMDSRAFRGGAMDELILGFGVAIPLVGILMAKFLGGGHHGGGGGGGGTQTVVHHHVHHHRSPRRLKSTGSDPSTSHAPAAMQVLTLAASAATVVACLARRHPAVAAAASVLGLGLTLTLSLQGNDDANTPLSHL